MAVYFTLAIDCAENESIAKSLAEYFHNHKFIIDLEQRSEQITCESSAYRSRRYWNENERGDKNIKDWWMTSVLQEINIAGTRSDLVNESNLRQVRNKLYEHLRNYLSTAPNDMVLRSAKFGVEAQDFLGGSDWPELLLEFLSSEKTTKYYEGIILNNSLVQSKSLRAHLEEFAPGYLWWNCFPERYV